MTTKTAEPQGHYEVDRGGGWERTTEDRMRVAVVYWHRLPQPVVDRLHAGAVVGTYRGRYRFVADTDTTGEDEPA